MGRSLRKAALFLECALKVIFLPAALVASQVCASELGRHLQGLSVSCPWAPWGGCCQLTPGSSREMAGRWGDRGGD